MDDWLGQAELFGDRPVDGEIGRVQADHPVVGVEPDAQQFLAEAGLGAPSARRRRMVRPELPGLARRS